MMHDEDEICYTSILIAIGGGPGTLKNVDEAVMDKIPVIVVKGSGRAADLMVRAKQEFDDLEAEGKLGGLRDALKALMAQADEFNMYSGSVASHASSSTDSNTASPSTYATSRATDPDAPPPHSTTSASPTPATCRSTHSISPASMR